MTLKGLYLLKCLWYCTPPPLASRSGIPVTPNIQRNGNKAAYNSTYYTYINVQCLHNIHQRKRLRQAWGWRSAVKSNQHFPFSLITVGVGWDAAGAPLCCTHTKIDYSDALSTGWFRKVFTLFCHCTHPHNSWEVDVRSILDGKKKIMTHVTGLVTLKWYITTAD